MCRARKDAGKLEERQRQGLNARGSQVPVSTNGLTPGLTGFISFLIDLSHTVSGHSTLTGMPTNLLYQISVLRLSRENLELLNTLTALMTRITNLSMRTERGVEVSK